MLSRSYIPSPAENRCPWWRPVFRGLLTVATFGVVSSAGLWAAGLTSGGTTVFRTGGRGTWEVRVRPAARTAQGEPGQVLAPAPQDAAELTPAPQQRSSIPSVNPAVSEAADSPAEETAPLPRAAEPASAPATGAASPEALNVQGDPGAPVELPPLYESYEDCGIVITPGPRRGRGDDLVNGQSYSQVYDSIRFSRAEYRANPSYRHDATMEILFGQLRPTTIIRQQAPVRPAPSQYYTPYRPYVPAYRDLWEWRWLQRPSFWPYGWPSTWQLPSYGVHASAQWAPWGHAPTGGCVWP